MYLNAFKSVSRSPYTSSHFGDSGKRKVQTLKTRNKFQRYSEKSNMVVMWALLVYFTVQVVLKLKLFPLTDFYQQ